MYKRVLSYFNNCLENCKIRYRKTKITKTFTRLNNWINFKLKNDSVKRKYITRWSLHVYLWKINYIILYSLPDYSIFMWFVFSFYTIYTIYDLFRIYHKIKLKISCINIDFKIITTINELKARKKSLENDT